MIDALLPPVAPAVGTRIPLSRPVLGGRERELMLAALDSGFVSSVGPHVTEFEDEIARRVGTRHAVACVNGTAALHLALLAHGVGPGDEVWVQDLTFIASANPVRYCGADVVLVDSERESWNLDPDLMLDELERRVARGEARPKAIIPVDLLGHPTRDDGWRNRCAELGVAVIEDSTEALGAGWTDGRACGTAGAFGAFSFNGNKMITTGGGGMLVTDDAELARAARHLSTQAKLPGLGYHHDVVGYNYRLTNVAAALGLAQLERLRDHVSARNHIAARYATGFVGTGVVMAPDAPWADRVHWLSCVLLEDEHRRDHVLHALNEQRIEARPLWAPLHEQAPYRDARRLGSGAVAADLASRGVCLPSSVDLDIAEQDEVIAVVREAAR